MSAHQIKCGKYKTAVLRNTIAGYLLSSVRKSGARYQKTLHTVEKNGKTISYFQT
jgi:ribosomal protein S17E